MWHVAVVPWLGQVWPHGTSDCVDFLRGLTPGAPNGSLRKNEKNKKRGSPWTVPGQVPRPVDNGSTRESGSIEEEEHIRVEDLMGSSATRRPAPSFGPTEGHCKLGGVGHSLRPKDA